MTIGLGLLAQTAGGSKFWLPEDLSTHGGRIDGLIVFTHWFMAALFLGWGIFFVYCLVRFRQRAGQAACYDSIKAKPSKYVEIFIVIIEGVLLIGFSIPAWAAYRDDAPPVDERLEIRVVAEQFAWNFHYPGPDGVFGRTDPSLMEEGVNPLGLDPDDPAGEDDIIPVQNQLHIPIGKPIYLRLSSKDVIHCFSIPVMRVKQDVVPGMVIPIWFEATSSGSNSKGEYDIQCAQLCGLGHYRMKGIVTLHDQAGFEAWLEEAGAEEEEFFDEDEFEDD